MGQIDQTKMVFLKKFLKCQTIYTISGLSLKTKTKWQKAIAFIVKSHIVVPQVRVFRVKHFHERHPKLDSPSVPQVAK